MANSNLTIYQRLSKVLNGSESEQMKYIINRDLIKDLDPEAYAREKLEAQQTLYLQGLWRKIDNELFQKAVFYEPTRIASYYDFESMEYSLHGDTNIVTLNGLETIKSLSERGKDYKFVTFAYDHNTKQVVPALARNAHYTRDEMTYKITFDDDSFIVATYGHRFLKRNGTYCKVEDLKIGDSMMPFYRKSFYKQKKYNWVYSCNPKIGWHGWIPEHTLVAEHLIRPLQDNEVVHHKDFNGKNNLVENLEIMDASEHQAMHARHNNEKLWINPEYRAKMAEVAKDKKNKYHWDGKRSGKNNPAYFELDWDKVVQYSKTFKGFKQTAIELGVSAPKLRRTIKEHGYSSWEHFITGVDLNEIIYDNRGDKHPLYKPIPWDNLIETAIKCKTAIETARQLNVSWHKIMDDIKRGGYNDWQTFIEAYDTTVEKKQEEDVLVNHKIKSIEPYGVVPVYDLTVPGYKNFATDTIFSHNTPEIGAALDLYMEESCTADENGQILQIYSESNRIKNILDELFYDILDINANIQPWTRNTPIRSNSLIPLLNNEIITIKEIAERLKNNPNDELWTYAIKEGTKDVVGGKIVWCDLTRENSELYRITLDDGTYVDTTPDHEFMLRNGTYKRADQLKKGVSLMPFYTRISSTPEDCFAGYEKVYNPRSDYFKFTHHAIIDDHLDLTKEQKHGYVTHHCDFNKLNNTPNNLKRMTVVEHTKYHANLVDSVLRREDVVNKRLAGIDKYLRSDARKKRMSEEMKGTYPKYFKEYNNSEKHDEDNEIRKQKMLHHWGNEQYKKHVSDCMTIKFDQTCFNYFVNVIKTQKGFTPINTLVKELKNDKVFISLLNKANPSIERNFNKSVNATTLSNLIERQTNKTFYDFYAEIRPEVLSHPLYIKSKNISTSKKQKKLINHKVVSIIKLLECDDVYCMEIVGKNNSQDRHNFPVCTIDAEGNYSRNGVFVSNCKYGDNFLYLKVLPKKGIVGCKQLPNIELTRVEPDFQKVTSLNDMNRETNIKFYWKNKDLEFNTFEMAHFRLLGDDRRLPYGTCLARGTAVVTQNGYKEIQNIIKDDMVQSFNRTSQQFEYSKVLDVVNSGKKQTYKISSKHYFIEASEEHKIMIYNKQKNEFEYKNVLDIKLNDLLVGKSSHNLNNAILIDKSVPSDFEKSLTYSKENHYWDNIDLIPDEVTPEFAELFGFLIGDGSLDKNTIIFSMGVHQEINNKYADLLEKFSGHVVKDRVYHPQLNARCYSKMLVTILKRMGFNGLAHTKRIPSWVFNASDKIKESFINGFFQADGSINIDKWNCCLYTIEVANEYLIRDLKLLLQSLGYKCGKVLTRQRENVIIKGIKVKNIRPTFRLNYYQSKLKQTKINDIKNRLTDEFILEPIISIEKGDIAETYDIYVEHPEHNFVANNIVVHNSMLDKARRIWKQLVMAEDAMNSYRLVRAPERRVHKIFVGNMDDKDIDAYVDKVANNFRRTPVVDSANGNIDLRYNMLPVWKNTPIPLLDGRTISIEELAREYDNGKENWVYSVQDQTHKIVAGKVVWCGKNYTANKLIKIWLDDDTWMMMAPEHPMILRDGTHKPAEQLKPNDSLMPFYVKKSTKKDKKKIIGYETIFNPNTNKYEYVHTLISDEKYLNNSNRIPLKYRVIHHADFNKLNNVPSNLEEMHRTSHWQLHYNLISETLNSPEKLIAKTEKIIEYNKSEKKRLRNIELAKEQQWHKRFEEYNHSYLHKEHDKLRREAMKSHWCDPVINKQHRQSLQVHFDDFVFSKINEQIFNGNVVGRTTMLNYLSNELIDYIISINNNKRLNRLHKIERSCLEREINQKGFNTITEYVNAVKTNHKVKYIEEIYANEDVYCMTVVGMNDENDRHNFAMKSFNLDGSISVSGSFSRNSVDQDIFVPTRDPALPNPIDTLPGACLDLTTPIELFNGESFTLYELISKFEKDEELRVWSVNPQTGELASGKVTWAGVTRKNTDVVKITVENNKEFIVTLDHKIPVVGYGKKEAKDLVQGDYLYSLHDNTIPSALVAGKTKVLSVELLPNKIDTGTLTIDGNEIEHNFHTFALSNGVFVYNSNLSEIADIEYVQNKLLTALRIPKQFLGFDDAVGEGKNLAMMDVRFARTIYRIQKAIVQELNKIAIIHLYLKGFEDELNNFSLSLTNPSTQQDLLKIERWREKVLLYRDAVTSQDGGFAAMSATKAKKEILDMSDDEIKLDIQRQAVEKAAVEELKILGETIKQTGIFKDLYDIYNINPTNLTLPQGNEEGSPMGGGGGGGGGGLGGASDLGAMPEPPEGEEGEGEVEANAPNAPNELPNQNVGGGNEEEEGNEENDLLKENFFKNKQIDIHQKRISRKLEKRNLLINEDIGRLAGELDILSGSNEPLN